MSGNCKRKRAFPPFIPYSRKDSLLTIFSCSLARSHHHSLGKNNSHCLECPPISLLLHPGDLSRSLLSLANVHFIHESPGSVSGPSSGLPQALLLLDLLLCVSTSRGPRILYKQGWGCSPLMPQHLAQHLIQSSYSTPFSWLVEWLQVSCSKFSFDFCSSMPLPLGSC